MGGVCYEISIKDHFSLVLCPGVHVDVVHRHPLRLADAREDLINLLRSEFNADLAQKG